MKGVCMFFVEVVSVNQIFWYVLGDVILGLLMGDCVAT
jgi:hypothetical protein